jgi:DNA-binding CsgD family transcriptional regulator
MALAEVAASAAATASCDILVADAPHSGAAEVARRVAQELALSRRETQVLVSVSLGKCIKETAAELAVSEKAVQYFWARIFAKSGCTSQVQVLALLLRHVINAYAR